MAIAEARGFEPLEGKTLAGFQDQCIQPDSATPPFQRRGEGGIRTLGRAFNPTLT